MAPRVVVCTGLLLLGLLTRLALRSSGINALSDAAARQRGDASAAATTAAAARVREKRTHHHHGHSQSPPPSVPVHLAVPIYAILPGTASVGIYGGGGGGGSGSGSPLRAAFDNQLNHVAVVGGGSEQPEALSAQLQREARVARIRIVE
mmetsp:Transcript_4182/g.10835  ORF Transcript_4182/g.10835 Transcript_4182/m.10835 type:complete len:149 (-) Transcript_4182:1872-2318(-)